MCASVEVGVSVVSLILSSVFENVGGLALLCFLEKNYCVLIVSGLWLMVFLALALAPGGRYRYSSPFLATVSTGRKKGSDLNRISIFLVPLMRSPIVEVEGDLLEGTFDIHDC
jgi:hypothetical protein